MNKEDVQQQEAVAASGIRLRVILAVLLAWLVFAILFPLVFYQAPAPLDTDAPGDQFSAMRADKILELLVGDGIPHPAGSEQNDIVRERIVELVESFGYEPVIQETEHTLYRVKEQDTIIGLENILFRREGTSDGKAIMLVSHYDSVRRAPGASDDGVGTSALLEVARMLKTEGPFERDIIFLITDGEEFGLLGADKFVREHPWAEDVECCINVEARGTEGPSFMFETSENTRWMIPLFARASRRPMTSSLYYEVYKRLPNDTDFTIFKAAGMQGFNFAFIRNVNYYHTEDDNYENVSRASMQHHGEQMLGLARALANLDFESQPKGTAVYFDVAGLYVVWWSSGWSIWMSLIGTGTVLGCGLAAARKPTSSSKESGFAAAIKRLLVAAGAVILGVALMFAAGFAVHYGLTVDDMFDIRWPQAPAPLLLLLIFFAFPQVLICGTFYGFPGRVTPQAAWLVVWSGWGAMALLLSVQAAGASYLFIVPLMFAAIGAFANLFLKQGVPGFASESFASESFASESFALDGFAIASCSGAVAVGFIWLPIVSQLYDAFGFRMNFVYVGVAAIAGSSLLPLFAGLARRNLLRLLTTLGILSLLCVVAAAVVTRLQ